VISKHLGKADIGVSRRGGKTQQQREQPTQRRQGHVHGFRLMDKLVINEFI